MGGGNARSHQQIFNVRILQVKAGYADIPRDVLKGITLTFQPGPQGPFPSPEALGHPTELFGLMCLKCLKCLKHEVDTSTSLRLKALPRAFFQGCLLCLRCVLFCCRSQESE